MPTKKDFFDTLFEPRLDVAGSRISMPSLPGEQRASLYSKAMSLVPKDLNLVELLRRTEQTALGWANPVAGSTPGKMLSQEPTPVHLCDDHGNARCNGKLLIVSGWYGPVHQADCPDCLAWYAASKLREDNER